MSQAIPSPEPIAIAADAVTTAPEPVAAEDRIAILDIVRGFALMGIFIMNMPGFATSFFVEADGSHRWTAQYDIAAESIRDMLFDGKFNSMFSLLFGVGFTIQLGRLMQRQVDGAAIGIYVRRLLVLFLFGLLHVMLLWPGDVLHIYAMLGFLLLFLRNVSDRAIFALMAGCILFIPLSGVVRLFVITPAMVAQRVAEGQMWEAGNNLAFGAGTYLDTVRERMAELLFFYGTPLNLWGSVGFFGTLLTTMLIGFLIGRHKLYARIPELMPIIRKWQWWALGIGLVCAGIFGAIGLLYRVPGPSPIKVLGGVAYVICRLALMSFYVLTIVRLAELPVWRQRFSAFAIAGRMPLTNYLMQSLIACTLFQNWGVGLWGKVGPALGLLLAISVFFLVQVPLSRWWLARYRFGPMEWLWRYATYGKRPAMRIAAA
ncbi:MAG: DUF418 domain-containing protein [Betaproteobacteria bacterium]|nr:DUF418 domain-containing protein [Betaproteobacteria bacterium]